MTKAQTQEIEQAVRKVLGEVLSDASDELGSPDNDRGMGASAFAGEPDDPDAGQGDSDAIPEAVLSAVKTLCDELSPEQAESVAELFEAIASQDEEPDEEPDEDEEPDVGPKAAAGAYASAYGEVELESEAAARAEGRRLAASGKLALIIRLLKKSKPLLRAATKAARRGVKAFKRWANGLSNFNPLKWAIKVLPNAALMQLIDWLDSQASVRARS